MSGGAEEGLETSLLETPTWVLAIVFTVFMLLSFVFEIASNAVRHFFLRRGRHGLADAWDKLVGELTLLGFVSLLLTAFAAPLGNMCVPYSESMANWTLESTIPGCPCCLATTHGISLCAEMDHGCLFNASSHSAYCDCELTGTQEYIEEGLGLYTEVDPLAPDTCMPFDSYEALYFLEISARSLNTAAEYYNVSRRAVCDSLGNATWDDADTVEVLEEELDWDPADWPAPEQSARRRQRRLLSGGGERAPGSRRRLSAKAGGGAEERVVVDPLRVLLGQDNSSGTTLHMLPRLKLFKCTGPFLSSTCPNGEVLLITPEALHQVHIWLFLVAIVHVAVSVLQIVLGKMRLRLWRRWEAEAQALEACGRANMLAAAPSRIGYWHDRRGSSRFLFGPRLAPPHEEGAAGSGGAALSTGSGGSAGSASASEGGKPADVEAAGDGPKPEAGQPAGGTGTCAAGAAADGTGAGAQSARERLSRFARAVRRRWRYRRPHFTRVRHYLAEFLICFIQALSPNIVTRHNFMIMRQTWLASQPSRSVGKQEGSAAGEAAAPPALLGDAGSTAAAHAAPTRQGMLQGSAAQQHGAGEGESSAPAAPPQARHWTHYCLPCCGGVPLLKAYCPDSFVDHLLRCVEEDTPHFVGLSVEMVVVVCVTLVVVGHTGVTDPVFLMASALLLLITNVMLVALLRHCCRGGQPHGRALRWWRSPRLLLSIPIRLILFLCSFIYASRAFFAWQFGAKSCFFIVGPWGLPWWVILISTSVKLLWISVATIPAFSLVVHSQAAAADPSAHRRGSHADISMLAAVIKGSGSSGAGAAAAAAAMQRQNGSVHASAGVAPPGGSAAGGAGQAEAALQAEVAQLRARVALLEAALQQGDAPAQT